MAGDLQDLRNQLRSVTAELATMPAHKAGTEWHSDRVNEAEWLHRTIGRMTEARRVQAELN